MAAVVGQVVMVSSLITLALAGSAVGAPSGSGSDGGGTVSVGAVDGVSTAAGPGVNEGGAGTASAAGTPGKTKSPWSCSDQSLALNDEGFPPGGATPGGWYSVTCIDATNGATTTATEWITVVSSPTPAAPVVNPQSLALQAENSLALPRPDTHFSPSAYSVVNLPTWLWIDAAAWQVETVSATAGTVSATAVATPTSVSWSMGDGSVVTCPGPGVPYDMDESSSSQRTNCQHVYAATSAGRPTPDGDENDDAFVVTATVAWTVTWTAAGAPGGGKLPDLYTSSSTNLRVEQVQSINGLASDEWADTPSLGHRL